LIIKIVSEMNAIAGSNLTAPQKEKPLKNKGFFSANFLFL